MVIFDPGIPDPHFRMQHKRTLIRLCDNVADRSHRLTRTPLSSFALNEHNQMPRRIWEGWTKRRPTRQLIPACRRFCALAGHCAAPDLGGNHSGSAPTSRVFNSEVLRGGNTVYFRSLGFAPPPLLLSFTAKTPRTAFFVDQSMVGEGKGLAGCSRNWVDTEVMLGIVLRAGYEVLPRIPPVMLIYSGPANLTSRQEFISHFFRENSPGHSWARCIAGDA